LRRSRACGGIPLASGWVDMAARRWLRLLSFALLALMTNLGSLEAQTTNRFAGTFEERFANMGKVTPVFARPGAPAPSTNMDVAPPASSGRQDVATPVEQQRPASAPEERRISPTPAAGPPTPPRSQALQPLRPQVIAAIPTSPRQTASPGAVQAGRRIASGRATWYEQPGRTASGETFDPNRLTAAHRTLPFGTRLRVVNQRNGRSVIVRINDRSPPTLRSVLNLSRGSARVIGLTGAGSVSLYKVD